MQSYAMIIVICIRNIAASEDIIFKGFNIPCKDSSPQCVKAAFQAVFPVFVQGIPSLGIDTLDPFVVDKLNLTMPGGLAIAFNEGMTKGLRKCIINSASFSKNQFNVVLHCNFTTKGNYRSYGKLFMFPIDGNGDATIVCKNLKLECSFKLDTIERSGKKFLVIKEHDIRHSYQGQVFYQISNLFKGNPEISNMVLDFMNRNWLEIAEEFGDPIVNFGIQTIMNSVEKLIRTVPADQLINQTDVDVKF